MTKWVRQAAVGLALWLSAGLVFVKLRYGSGTPDLPLAYLQ